MSHPGQGCHKMIFVPRFLPSLRGGRLTFALFRWYRCSQPPATVWQFFGLQPPLGVGAQKLRCARLQRSLHSRGPGWSTHGRTPAAISASDCRIWVSNSFVKWRWSSKESSSQTRISFSSAGDGVSISASIYAVLLMARMWCLRRAFFKPNRRYRFELSRGLRLLFSCSQRISRKSLPRGGDNVIKRVDYEKGRSASLCRCSGHHRRNKLGSGYLPGRFQRRSAEPTIHAERVCRAVDVHPLRRR